jgi:hypothetical protein
MLLKAVKWGVIGIGGLTLAGALVFGRDMCSYATSGARAVRSAAHDAVPIEFQLRRAHDLVADIVPEMQANVRLIAQQEVEIDALRNDIATSEKSLDDERVRMTKIRDSLGTERVSFTFGPHAYSRDQLKQDLARRLDTSKEADIVLAGKRRLLENRQKSLAAAVQMLEKARSQKAMLESQIATLEGQYKLVQAASVGSAVAIDNSKLAQSQKLIDDIKKQLDVAERVLAHESKFIDPIQVDAVTEKDLLTQVDDYLGAPKAGSVSGNNGAEDGDRHEVPVTTERARTAAAK